MDFIKITDITLENVCYFGKSFTELVEPEP